MYVGIGTDIVSTVADATERLQKRYINSKFSSLVDDEWPPYQPKHYTTLAFIHNKGKSTDAVRFSVTQELAVTGNINTRQVYKHSDLHASMTRNISDIFLPIMASDGSFIDLCILIEGAPGIGKTILAKEVAYQWAKNELLTSKKLLLLVFLRECSQTQLESIEQLVQYVIRNDEMALHLTNYLLKADGEGAVIVFDGFDELSEENRKKSLIVDIINRRILAKSCLVITSRPTASSSLHASVDRRVEIVGFTEEDRLDYIQTALENSDEQIKALQHYLQSNPTINALCYIPLNMTILLCLVEDGIDKLPKTQSEMYKTFIQITVVRFIKKYDKFCDLIITIADLPHPYDKLLVELAKLAYEALKTDKVVFTLTEIKERCPNLTMTSSNWNGLGLLKAVRYFNAKMGSDQVTFHFLHFSIQEYMAAWYISTLPDHEQIKLLKETFWEHRYYNTWTMYIGITCGSSFALRHFLSGNRFRFYSKLFKSFKVSNKFLKHKMKCLHLFQCLVEANKEGIIESVKQLFENNQIDLSNQTLLPSDLNTLGFFLIRSINKEWDVLNLSNCNIGSEGSNILCDRFLEKDVRYMFTIKIVNFSYNQLNLSSLMQLFGLFNFWHTSEIIITDDAILNNTTDIKAIEDVVLQSSTLMLVFIGSYLFSRNLQLSKIVHILSNTTNIKSIYLLNCTWKSNDSKTLELLTLLEKQKLDKVRIIGPSLNAMFIKKMALILLHNKDPANMFVYDPTMSDEIADDISSLIASSSKDMSDVMLIVSSGKIQGIVNTCTLSSELSALELFNLSIYIRYLNTKMCPWRENLEGKRCIKESIIYTFVEMLYKIDYTWQLKIAIIENDTLIAHKAENMNKLVHGSNNASVIYLSNCDNNKPECDIIINEACSTLHIFNSLDCVELLYAKLLHKQCVPIELFIYGNIKYTLINDLVELVSHHHHNISAVLVANDVLVALHPNVQQIALAFRLQPSSTKWILSTTDNASIFYQIIDVLSTFHANWIELDFTGCNIGDIQCEIIYRTIEYKNCSTVNKLNISFNKLSVSGIPYLVKIILTWGVQELNINGTDDVLYNCLIENFIGESKHESNIFLSITYNQKIIYIVFNTSWNEISTVMNNLVSELYIISCKLEFSSTEIISYLNTTHNLLRLRVIHGTVSETLTIEILQTFLNQSVEVSISDVKIIGDGRMIKNFITSKEFCLDIKLSLVLSTDHWLCVYNITKYQLNLMYHYFMSQSQPDYNGVLLIRKLEQVSGGKLCIFENNLVSQVRFHAKALQVTGATQIITALSNTISLKMIEIENYIITSEAADNLAFILQCNTQLQVLHLNGNSLQINNIIKIAKALHDISICDNNITDNTSNHYAPALSDITSETNFQIFDSIMTGKSMSLHNLTLTRFCISNNSITAEAADDIAAVISCNIHLQELNLGGNNFQALGTTKIARSLQKISSLTKLYMNHNNITHEAADDIADAISCNIKLQELNLCSNGLQTSGIIKIARSLQKISSLTKLYIDDNSITYEAADDIADAISCNIKLQELNLGSNGLQTSGIIKIARSLQRISSLTKLYINHNNITYEAADDIAAAVSSSLNLQEFDIGNNNIQSSGAIKVAKGLKHISTLTKLCFHNSYITDEATDGIAATISCNTKLQEIDLSENHLQATGTIKIMKAIQRIHTLKILYVNSNNISDEAADDIANAIRCANRLYRLDVSNNRLQTEGIKKILKPLKDHVTLTKLYISNNNVTDEASNDIAAAVSNNTELQEFNVSGNNFETTGNINIAVALQNIATLTKLCISNNNITCKVANDIADTITCNNHLQEFIISRNNLQASGAAIIAKGLQNISTLTKLYIHDNKITQKAADDIAAVVTSNSHLKQLDISENELQDKGVIVITKALHRISTLTKLYLRNNNITHKAADHIAAAISCNSCLQKFNIGGNNLQTAGAIIIARSLQKISSLEKLYINHNNITQIAADDIAAAISCNSKLQVFDISGNNLQTIGAIKVVNALKGICTLKELYLNNIYINHEVAEHIATVISYNSKLQVFDISGNNLQTTGAIKVVNALKGIYTLKELYLNNIYISHEVAEHIAAVISCNTCLQGFSICRNNLQAKGTISIAEALQDICTLRKLYLSNNNITDEAADYVADAIFCNTKLQEINMSKNNFQTAGMIKIIKALQKNRTLKILNLSSNNITDSVAIASNIATAISSNIHLQELDVSGNNILGLGTVEIAKGLQRISGLTKLYIQNNNVIQYAADVISHNTQLKELDVTGSNLQVVNVIKIAENLQHISTLTKLYISNSNITNKAAQYIAAAIFRTKLEEFDINKNNLETEGAKNIAVALQSIVTLKKLRICNNKTTCKVDDIAVAITCNNHLREFIISASKFQASGAAIIAKALQNISTLTKLYINNYNISDEAAHDIAIVVSCNTKLQEFNIGRNNLHTFGAITIATGLQKISTLTKLCVHDNNITYYAANDIAAAISHNTQIEELDISRNNIETKGVINIAKQLQLLSTLKILCISNNNITDEAADYMTNVILYNSHLQEFDISVNNLQVPGIIKIAKGLQKISTLTKLYINNNNITEEAADDIAGIIVCNSYLQEVDIQASNLQTMGAIQIAQALQKISSLTKLYINDNHITEAAADDIAAAISCNAIQVLDVSNNNLKATGVKKLAKSLQNVYTLTNLYMSNNNITDSAADDIAVAISCNPHLKEFDIGENKLEGRGAIKLAKSLQHFSTLRKLFMDNNLITEEAADDIAAVISCNIHLQELNLGGNNFQALGTIKIAKSLQKISSLTKLYMNHNNITYEAADDIANAISCNIKLQELNLGSNGLQTSGIIKIATSLQKISSLTKLYINHNNITYEAADDIAAAVYSSLNLQEFDIGNNNIQSSGAIKVAKGLIHISTLTKLCFRSSYITDKAADGIAATISCNIKLQEIDLSENHLQATGTIKIMKAIQRIHTLKVLYVNSNNISDEAADDIANAIRCANRLYRLDVSNNRLQTEGIKKILKPLKDHVTLTKLYISNNNVTDEASNDIAAAVSNNTELQEFNVSGNNFETTGNINIAVALQNIATLTKLCISNNNITCKVANDIADTITCNNHLQEFIISRNNLQASGAAIIAKGLQNISTLTKLYIHDNKITQKAADDIAAVVTSNSHLKQLDISENELQDKGVIVITKALHRISTLTKLYLRNNNITHKAADHIAAAISCNSCLQKFNIGGNNLQTAGAIIIAKSLQKISSLKKLYINHNNITQIAANDIAAAISCNSKLQVFDISGNNLQTIGAIIVVNALKGICTLKELYLNNIYINHEVAEHIATVISYNSKLQVFDISGNNLQTTGAIKVVNALKGIYTLKELYLNNIYISHEVAEHIAAVISCNTCLQGFSICRNNLQAKGTISIAEALQDICTLRKLYLSNNNITDEAADYVADAIFCNTKLQEIDVGKNNFQTTGMITIIKALQKICTLKILNLSYCSNNITDSVAIAYDIATAISSNIHLQELDISGNNVQGLSTVIIARSLQRISGLTKLYIQNNNVIHYAADDIADVISHNTQLKELDVSGNYLQAVGVTKIAESLQCISTLTKLYISNSNITNKAAQYIAAAISRTKLEEFNISKNNLETEGAKNIAVALQSIVTLTKLCISNNNVICEVVDAIAVAITCNNHLQEFIISGNNLQASGATVIANSLQNISTLTKLYIDNNNISDEAADDIAAAISHNTQMKELDISRNNLETKGVINIAKQLQLLSTLKILCISNNNITDEAADYMTKVILCNSHLQEFDISVNNLQVPGIIKIAKGLQKISTLTKLYINNNNITEKAADDIASIIVCNSYLQEIDIQASNLQTMGAIIIAQALQKISSLTTLYINDNHITDEAADDIAAVISCNAMQVLDVSNNNLKTTGVKKLAKSLQNACTLTNLYMSNNNITDSAADDIAVAISCNPHLKEFDIGENKLEGRGAIKLAKVCSIFQH